jgi:hypothetical protein
VTTVTEIIETGEILDLTPLPTEGRTQKSQAEKKLLLEKERDTVVLRRKEYAERVRFLNLILSLVPSEEDY